NTQTHWRRFGFSDLCSEVGRMSLLSAGKIRRAIQDILRFAVMNGRKDFVLNPMENVLNVFIKPMCLLATAWSMSICEVK
ncbi:MAG: hypothetical protein M1609_16790, partial [Firmicutes bacterium]|nr:hypothetical protein [Bacillota bacterium]